MKLRFIINMKNFDMLVMSCVLFISVLSNAQEYQFGYVTEEELLQKSYELDSTVNAAVLFESKKVYYESTRGDLTVVTEIVKRIKFYNKFDFDHATENILRYKNKNVKEKLISIKGFTYSLINGKIEKTELDVNDIYEEEYSENYEFSKFLMPNVKEGSIIEFKYKIVSPFVFDIDKINLQYNIPVKKLDVLVKIPSYINFRKFSTGFVPINLKEFTKKNSDFKMNVHYYNSSNVPAFKEEPYSGNSDNYISSILYEVSVINYPNGVVLNFSHTWEDVVKTIYKNSNFGTELKKTGYFKKEVNDIVKGIDNIEDKVYAIYNCVQKKMVWNKKRSLFTRDGVKKAFKKESGNSAEINLMLTSMLDYIGVDANPVLVSTSDRTLTLFPTVKGFNYVIARAKLPDGKILYLDATDKYGLPNILPDRVLKGLGRVVSKDENSQMINYRPVKPSVTKINLQYDISDDGKINGRCSVRYFDFFAHRFREQNSQKGNKELLRRLEKIYELNDLSKYSLEGENDLNKAVKEQFSFEIDNKFEEIEGEIYFSPLLFLAESESIFKSNERKHPIDFGFGFSYSYLINIKIPKNYRIVELPKETSFRLPKKLGIYNFKITANQNLIQVLVKKTINNSIITPEYYIYLKEYYNQIIQKEEQQIVLKK